MSSGGLENSKAYVEIVVNVNSYIAALNKANTEAMGKDDKMKIAQIKKMHKYEEQFKKMGYKKQEAHQKALAEISKKQYEQQKNEFERTIGIRAGVGKSKMSKFLQGDFGGGAFWVKNLLGRSISQGLGTRLGNMMHSAGSIVNNIISTQEKMDREDFFGEKQNKEALIKKSITTGSSIEDIQNMQYQIATARGKGMDIASSNGIMDVAEKIRDPIYSMNQAVSDLTGFLKGGALDNQGNFANKFGQGKTRQMNALLSQQQALIDAGIYQDMSDPRLIKEREQEINNLQGKLKGDAFKTNKGTLIQRGLDLEREESKKRMVEKASEGINAILADKSNKGVIDSLTSMILNPDNTEGATAFQAVAINTDPNTTLLEKLLINISAIVDLLSHWFGGGKSKASTSNEINQQNKNNTKQASAKSQIHSG